MSELVERVARAIAAEMHPNAPYPQPADERAAKAALAAIPDAIGWPEIEAFRAEIRKGQDIYEDAGGFFIRQIRALFGSPSRDPVQTHQDAARALIETASRP